MGACSPMPRLLLISPPRTRAPLTGFGAGEAWRPRPRCCKPRAVRRLRARTRSVFRRLWCGGVLEADAPMPQPLLILPPQARSAVHRLRPGAMLGADAPMPQPLLILPPQTRSVFHRLWPGAMLGADAPMPRLLLILPPRTRSVFRRLRPGAMLGAVSPMLWTACCAATADTQCPSPALARRGVKCRVSGAVLIVHTVDPPAIQAPPFPIGSTG